MKETNKKCSKLSKNKRGQTNAQIVDSRKEIGKVPQGRGEKINVKGG